MNKSRDKSPVIEKHECLNCHRLWEEKHYLPYVILKYPFCNFMFRFGKVKKNEK